MENAVGIQLRPEVRRNNAVRAKTMRRLSIVEWYRVLRAHHHWAIFQAIRYALWLAR